MDTLQSVKNFTPEITKPPSSVSKPEQVTEIIPEEFLEAQQIDQEREDQKDLDSVRKEIAHIQSTHEKSNPISRPVEKPQHTSKEQNFVAKVKTSIWALYDFVIPLRSLNDPIPGYPQKLRIAARLWRTRIGYTFHLSQIPVAIATHDPFYLAVNVLGIVGTAYGHFDNPRRMKRLIPLQIRKLFGSKDFI